MKTVITAKIKDEKGTWNEKITIRDKLTDNEAKKYVQTLIENFNHVLRPDETELSLIQIVKIERYFT